MVWPEFNHSIQCFATKKKFRILPIGVVARAGQLRPLTLKNSDSKIIASATARVNMPVWQRSVVSEQRGFVRGRQL
eukprot:5959692-Karenia_brevis.AAC.1